jgi:hypothetical protein
MTTELAIPRAPAMAMGTLSDPKELGTVLAASGYFQDAREAAQAVVKVLAGAELGFGPIASMTGVFIVKGRVTLSANLMAAAIKRHPKYDYRIRDYDDSKAVIQFFQLRNGEWTDEGTSEFTMEDAKRANLAGGENWKKYPRNMLLWRAMSNGAKFYCPDAFSGAPVYMPDELGIEIDGATGEVLDAEPIIVTPAPPTRASEPGPSGGDTPPSPSEPASAAESTGGGVEASPVATPTPADDPNRDVTGEEVVALRELLDRLNAPESFWRTALMGFNVPDMASLKVGQAHEIMEKANKRYGVTA